MPPPAVQPHLGGSSSARFAKLSACVSYRTRREEEEPPPPPPPPRDEEAAVPPDLFFSFCWAPRAPPADELMVAGCTGDLLQRANNKARVENFLHGRSIAQITTPTTHFAVSSSSGWVLCEHQKPKIQLLLFAVPLPRYCGKLRRRRFFFLPFTQYVDYCSCVARGGVMVESCPSPGRHSFHIISFLPQVFGGSYFLYSLQNCSILHTDCVKVTCRRIDGRARGFHFDVTESALSNPGFLKRSPFGFSPWRTPEGAAVQPKTCLNDLKGGKRSVRRRGRCECRSFCGSSGWRGTLALRPRRTGARVACETHPPAATATFASTVNHTGRVQKIVRIPTPFFGR